MPNILLVDDDETFLLSLKEGLTAQNSDFNIVTAGNGKEALTQLKQLPIDLVVTDLKMPEMDGFELLAHIVKNHKLMPVILITAFGTPETERALRQLGPVQYLEKPLDYNVLEEKITEGLKYKTYGYVKGISLACFLQVIGMEAETCTLKIRSKEKIGYMYFENGNLINAELDHREGEEPAYEIAVWDDVEIEIEHNCRKKTKRISKVLNHILLEAYRRNDEYKKKPIIEYNNDLIINQEKESKMNIKKLQDAIRVFKEDLGEGLLASDIYSNSDCQSIAGYNSQPKACALFGRITMHMNKTLKETGFPQLGQYYIVDLADKKRVLVMPLGDYQWGSLIDGSTPLGMVLNVALPKAIDAFEEAITG
ncbi:MAG: response regulator [Candidatus Omnitrophota bacterium]